MQPSIPSSLRLNLLLLTGTAVFVIPFFYSGATLDPALTPRFLILAGYVLIALVMLTLQNRKSPSTIDLRLAGRIIFPAALAHFIIAALSMTQAVNLSESLFELLKISLVLAFFLMAALIINSRENAAVVLASSITIAALVLAIIGVCQYYFLAFNGIPGNFLVYATMANKNLFASALFLMFPFILYSALQFSGFWRVASLVTLAMAVFCFIITQTRAVWLGLAAAAIVIAGCGGMLIRRKQISRTELSSYLKRLQVAAIIAIAVAAFSVFSHSRNVATDVRVERAFARPASSIDERLTLWKKTAEMIRGHPLLGVGLGNWKIELPRYGVGGMRSEMGTVHFQRPHNDFLWVLSETGPFGLISYAAVFAIAVGYAFKILRSTASANEKILVMLMLFGLSGYLTIAAFDFPKERIEHSVFLMLILATMVSVYHKQFPVQRTAPVFLARGLVFCGVLLSVLSITTGYFRLRAEIHTKLALAARDAGNWQIVIAEIDRAVSPLATMDPMATPLAWYRGVAHFSLNNFDAAFADFKQAHEIHPYHLHVLNNLATCYELKGDHQSAITHYEKALAISPRFEESLINLSAVHYNLKEYKKAYETISLCDPASKNPRVQTYFSAITSKLARKDSL